MIYRPLAEQPDRRVAHSGVRQVAQLEVEDRPRLVAPAQRRLVGLGDVGTTIHEVPQDAAGLFVTTIALGLGERGSHHEIRAGESPGERTLPCRNERDARERRLVGVKTCCNGQEQYKHRATHRPVQAQSQKPLNEAAETRDAGLGVHAKPSSYAAPTLSDRGAVSQLALDRPPKRAAVSVLARRMPDTVRSPPRMVRQT